MYATLCEIYNMRLDNPLIDSGLVGSTWEGYRESRRCSRDNYPESYINEYTSVYEDANTDCNFVDKSQLQ